MNEKKAQEERRLRVSMRLYVFEFVHARVCVWYPAKARYDTERQESAREQTRMEKKKRQKEKVNNTKWRLNLPEIHSPFPYH